MVRVCADGGAGTGWVYCLQLPTSGLGPAYWRDVTSLCGAGFGRDCGRWPVTAQYGGFLAQNIAASVNAALKLVLFSPLPSTLTRLIMIYVVVPRFCGDGRADDVPGNMTSTNVC